MNNKIKHLDMIQNIIQRMSKNSFTLKGWTITLIAGVFALASKDTKQSYVLVSFIPVIVFWFLDSYYLLIERDFKELYKYICLKEESDINFLMDVDVVTGKPKKMIRYIKCLVSTTEWLFYIPTALAMAVIIIRQLAK